MHLFSSVIKRSGRNSGWDKTRNRNGGTEWRNGMAERNGGSGMGIKRGMAEAERG